MLYALVLTHVMRDLGMTKSTAGLLSTLMLLASGIGGILFGFLADRIGRKRALLLSILTYSLCSFASASPHPSHARHLPLHSRPRHGGEWNTGATLVAETWPDDLRAKPLHRAKLLAIGFALAALVAGIVLRYANWRMVFFIGILPALVTTLDQKQSPESEMWLEHERDTNREPRSKQSALRSSGKSSSLPAPELVSNICLGKGTASAVPPSAATDEALAAEGRPPTRDLSKLCG